MIISKVISTLIEKGRNIVKVQRLGGKDIQTGYNVLPFGIDSNIPVGYRAIFADTGNIGDKIIVGIINDKCIANIGELRLHSEDSGTEKIYVYLKKDGTFELGGNTDFMVSYNNLVTEFNKLKKAFNDFALVYAPGSPSVTGLPATIGQCDADITKCKKDNLKTL